MARLVQENAAELGVSPRCTVCRADAVTWLSAQAGAGPFELILADPPYAAGAASRLLARASSPVWLARGGWIVLERDAASVATDDAGHGITRFRTARYGGTCLDFFAAAED